MNQAEDIQRTIQERFSRNLDFLNSYIPGLIKLIEEKNDDLSLKLDPVSGQLYKEKDDKPYYNDLPVKQAIEEVKNFYQTMVKNNYAPAPSSLMVSHVIKKNAFLRTLEAYAHSLRKQKGINVKPAYADVAIFGIGMGHHVEILMNKADFNSYVIIEKDIRKFKESLYTVNWFSILTNLPPNKYVSFIIKGSSESNQNFHQRIQYQFQELFPSSTTSTIIYNHATEDDYEDEKKVIADIMDYGRVSYERLAPDAHRLFNLNHNSEKNIPIIDLKETKLCSKKTPIAIVGAGPSLDIYLDTLRLNKEKIIIVSCGSSLRSLLENGIYPDFHFELEYQNLADDLVKYTSQNFDISSINFIGSLEAHPNLFDYFNNRFATIPQTTELSENVPNELILERGGITCTNGAAALFTNISTSDIYLVGLDFAHTNGMHHARDNITNQRDLPKNLERLENDGKTLLNRGSFIVEDVFGNAVKTTPSLNSARLLMETLAASCENEILNCSHGAKIPGTTFLPLDKFTETLNNLESNQKKFNIISRSISPERIHSLTKQTFDITFNVSEQITQIVRDGKLKSAKDFCHDIISLYKSIRKTTGEKRLGQFRSIMSVNRLPTLLLFNVINYAKEEDIESILKTWLDDYEDYINFIKDILYSHISSGNYWIDKDWSED